MTQTSEAYSKKHCIPKGTVMSEFIAERAVDVVHDPVAKNIFQNMDSDNQVCRSNYVFEIVKLPVSEFDAVHTSAEKTIASLDGRGLAPLFEGIAVMLWHLDRDILQPREGALVLTGIIEQAMVGRHMVSIAHDGEKRTVKWAPIERSTGHVQTQYPVQWVIAARKQ